MSSMPAAGAAQLSQTVDVETPELVVLSYTIAGTGSRASAAFIDYLICILSVIAMLIGLAQVARHGGPVPKTGNLSASWAAALLGLFQFSVLWLYYVLFEALADGQTPGKRIMNLRVVRDGGLAITFEASAIRNLVRIVDLQPVFLYAVGIVTIIVNSRGKRLGDIAAGTVVVKEDLVTQPMVAKSTRTPSTARVMLTAKLTDAEYALLDRFVQRRMEFEPSRRDTLARGIVARLSSSLETDALANPVTSLVRLHDEEFAARAQGVASRAQTGASRERHAIIATNAPRWVKFAERLKEAQRGGLKKLGERGVREFVQEYRELTADLARLRTATRGDSPELFYLNRLVAGAHSLLYRRRALTLKRVVNFLFVEVPSEIRASAMPIALAAALMFGPMLITGTAVIRHPELARTLLPSSMMERADEGVKKVKAGKGGYIDAPEILRPMMASSIITNNVQVSFAAFALGITGGVMTVWVLITNGISIGAVFGLYASKGIGKLLVAFVAPHGVLELFAITLAGAAGFLLAAGMLVPGDRTRRAALVANGRRAARLVGGAAFLLLFAGTLEGFVSPIPDWPLYDKLLVSAITAVALLLYVQPGIGFVRRWKERRQEQPQEDYSAPRPLISKY